MGSTVHVMDTSGCSRALFFLCLISSQLVLELSAHKNDVLDQAVSLLDLGTADLFSRFSDAPIGASGLASEVDVPWYSSTPREHDSSAREVLEVSSIFKEHNFASGSGVVKWMTLVVGSTVVLVGLRSEGITVLTASFIRPDIGSGQTYSLSEVQYDTIGKPSAASLFKHWNSETKQLEAILVLAVDSPSPVLTWYRLGDKKLEQIRSWPVLKAVTYLKAFEVGDQYKLLLVTQCDTLHGTSPCRASAEIYDFSLTLFEPKLSQTFLLDGVASSVEIGSVGDEFYLALALPEVGLLKLYHYHTPTELERKSSGNTTHGWFQSWRDIKSPSVSQAIFFHVSYKMYLAVGGTEPAILRFTSPTQLEGCPKALQNLGAVYAWMVLPVQTYRDEVIVLAELPDSRFPSKRTVVSLTWGGAGVFRLSDLPCYPVDVPNGLCLLEDNGIGLNDAVALQLGDASVVTVLMPRGVKHSALFRLNTRLQPVLNPLLREVLQLDQTKYKLEMELGNQEIQLWETDQMLEHTLNPLGPNVITANWVVQEVFTPEHESNRSDEDPMLYPKISDLLASLEKVDKLTKALSDSASDSAVFDGETVHLLGSSNFIGGIEVTGNVLFDDLSVGQLNGELVSSLLKDVVRIDKMDKIGGLKSLVAVEAVDVDFATLNDIPKDELVFDVPNKPIVIDGKLFLSEPLHIIGNIDLPSSGSVNNIDLSEEVFQSGKNFEGAPHIQHVNVEGDVSVDIVNTIEISPYSLRTISTGLDGFHESGSRYNNVKVAGNLEVEMVNGYMWKDIVGRIVWKDASDHIDGFTVVDGVLKSEGDLNIWQLNNVTFPDDYVLRQVNTQHVIGIKELRGQLLVGDVDVENSVDSVPVKSLVTLSTNQELDGVVKLMEADFRGDVTIDWSINGISFDQITKQSSVIGEGTPVSSNVDFSNLEVEGHIVVSKTVDGFSLKEFLDDLVPSTNGPMESLVIDSRKILQAGLTVHGQGISIPSGLMNGIHFSDFARVDLPQTFKGVTSVQQTTFRNLHLAGLWDDVDIRELNADTLRLDGKQDSSASLFFSPSSELWSSQLIILDNLNTELASTALWKFNGSVCDQQSSVGVGCIISNKVSANRVKVQGELIINGKICDKDLADFESRRLSRSRPQLVEGAISFGSLSVHSHLDISSINEVPVHIIGSGIPSQPKFNLHEPLWTGGFAVDDLFIEGNIKTQSPLGINDVDVAYISRNAVKLTGDNVFEDLIAFENLIDVSALEVHGPLNQQPFSFLIHDTVSRHDLDNVSISGVKTFYAGLHVERTVTTPSLSGLDTSKILTKSSPFILQGPLRVEGSVHGSNIDLNGQLNKLPVSIFQNRYKLSPEGRHMLRGNIRFTPDVSVEELVVFGRINGVKVDEFFHSVVLKSDESHIAGNKLFINRVSFNNITVNGMVQGIPLREFAHDVVLANEDSEVVVDGLVTFTSKLVANKGLTLSENLDAAELDGCLVKEWLDNAIYLHEPTHIGGVKNFAAIDAFSDLRLKTLNALDLSKVITLNQPQIIPTDMNILSAGVQHNLEVGGRVNGVHLPSEFDNTLMIKSNQQVVGQKTFLSGMTVNGNVVSKGWISGKNLSDAVTLYSVQTITGPIKFQSVVIDGSLHVDGLISDVDVGKWRDRAFLRTSPHPQIVSGQWTVLGNVRFMEDVEGTGLLGGENLHSLLQEVKRAQKDAVEIQNQIKVDWMQLCHDTNALLDKARAQPFLFQQLEVVQALPSPLTSSMHAFEAGQEQFLVVSYARNCSGAVYYWNGDRTSWDLVDVALQNVGAIERWASLQNANATYLITSTGLQTPNCHYIGGNVWRFGPGPSLRNIHTMEPWHEAQVDERLGHLYTLGQSGVTAWQIQDGTVSVLRTWPFEQSDQARFVPRNAGLGLSVSDGQWLTVFSRTQEQIANDQAAARSANPYLPPREKGSVAAMEVSNGRKLVAVAQDDADVLVVYDDITSGRTLGTVRAHKAHSLSVLELTGQTLLAFVEDERHLRVVQYKGVEGFVDVTEAKLAVSIKEMMPVRLYARRLVNPRQFLLLRSDHTVLLLELEMTGDPLHEPSLPCNL